MATSLLWLTFSWRGFHRPDESFLPMGWAAVVAIVSITLACWGLGTKWAECFLYLAVALFGQAASLSLIDAPRFGVFQHYAPWKELLSTPRGLFLVTPLLQSVVAVVKLWRARKSVLSWLRIFNVRQWAVLLVVAGFTAAYGNWDVGRYAGEVVLATWVMVANGAILVLVAASVPADFLARLAADLHEGYAVFARRLALAVAISVVLVSGTLAGWSMEGIPHITDEVGYLFTAKHFSAGRLYLPAPPVPSVFAYEKFYIGEGKWWSSGFPGWPAVLSLGVRAGWPWLVNPLLGGIAILLFHAVMSRFYGRNFAHGATLLLAASPWFLFISASYMTHALTLVLALLTLLAFENSRANWMPWGFLAGASTGALFLTRPLDALILASILGVRALGLGAEKLRFGALLAMILGGLVIGGLIIPYNLAITGRAFYPPHQKWADTLWYPGADRFGFGPDIGNNGWWHLDPFPGHGLRDVIVNTNQNSFMLSVELFGWGFGSLLFAVIGGFWKNNPVDRFFLAILFTTIGVLACYWTGGGPDFGARYWYLCLTPLVILTVRGVSKLREHWPDGDGVDAPVTRNRIVAFVVAACAVALITFVPWRSLDKYYKYRNVRSDVAQLARQHPFGHSLVFVRGQTDRDYASALILNPPTLEGAGPIFVQDPGPEARPEVMRHFPERAAWVIETHEAAGRFYVVAGPLPPLQSLAK